MSDKKIAWIFQRCSQDPGIIYREKLSNLIPSGCGGSSEIEIPCGLKLPFHVKSFNDLDRHPTIENTLILLNAEVK